jgi:hypothetical protein
VTRVAGELLDESPTVCAISDHDQCETEPGKPAFGASVEPLDVVRIEVDLGVSEEVRGFVVRDPKRAFSDLDQLAMRPQARNGQSRIGARRHDDLDGFGSVLDERRHRRVADRTLHKLPVVEDKDHGWGLGQLLQQEWHHRDRDRTWASGERRQRRLSCCGMHPS